MILFYNQKKLSEENGDGFVEVIMKMIDMENMVWPGDSVNINVSVWLEKHSALQQVNVVNKLPFGIFCKSYKCICQFPASMHGITKYGSEVAGYCQSHLANLQLMFFLVCLLQIYCLHGIKRYMTPQQFVQTGISSTYAGSNCDFHTLKIRCCP